MSYKRIIGFVLVVCISYLTGCVSENAAKNTGKISERKVHIVLMGDSTVTDKAGWGLGFKQFLTDRAECINTAAGGRSSKSFINEGRWTQALALKGDYYLIQFGHNDEPGKGPERSTDPNTAYREFMTRYVDETRAIDAKPILVTSLVRRQWDKSGSGKIDSSLTPYVETVKKLAKEKKVPLVDLHARSKELCEQLGKEKCYEFSPIKDNNQIDNTHLNAKGSVIFARLVVEELVRAVPELKPCFRSEPVGDTNSTEKVFDVRQFGAKGNGKMPDTEAIQKALDECGKAGGTVRLKAGTYLSKPIFLRSNTTLQLDEGATLKATDEPNDFADPNGGNNPLAFVNGNSLTNVAIVGKGTIDGSGARWWEPVRQAKKAKQPEPRRRPRMVLLSGCVGVRIKDVTLTNSPSFHLVPRDCEDVDIVRVTIRAPEDAPNTDAIDPSTSRYVSISNCVIDVGDDNIAIKSGHADPAHPNAASEYITVTDCTFLHGHGMSIGSDTVGGVRNLTVKHCTFENTESGIRIKSARDRGGLVENVSYSDITMKNVKIPINITAHYPKIPKESEDTAQPITKLTPIYRNIRISNLEGTSFRSAGFIVGLPECPISDVVLENVHITAPKGLTIRNAKVILKNVKIETQEGPPFILENNAVVEGLEQINK
jgi:lysophospholipase L1-like esterase